MLPGSGRDQLGSRRDQLRIEVILPGSGRDQLGSRRDQLRIEVILPGTAEDRRELRWSYRDQVGISCDHGEISSGSR